MSLRNSLPVSIIRTALLGPYFVIGCVTILATQEVAKIVFLSSPAYIMAMINLTKSYFIQILTFVTWVISPQKLHISFDKDEDGVSFSVDADGLISGQLLPNSVMISNHQIYTDWLNLWYLYYRSKFGDCVHIFLKDLSWIPVLGKGMKNYNFLFLSRKWESDKITIANQLLEVDANARGLGPANAVKQVSSVNTTSSNIVKWPQSNGVTGNSETKFAKHSSSQVWPYEFILFPEGTVTSPKTRKRSTDFCINKGIEPLENVLLPRVRGLFLTLRGLKNTVKCVYDITTGYSGLKKGDDGEEIFTLKRFYLLGDGPKNVHFYIKKWDISDIPLGEDDDIVDIDDVDEETIKKFEEWLFKIWKEKDERLNNFYNTGSFESIPNVTTVTGQLKNPSLLDAITPFLPIGACILLLRIVWLGFKKLVFG